MKRWWLLLLVLILMANTACAEDSWNLLDSANHVSNALQKTGSVGIRYVYFDDEGEEVYSTYSWVSMDAEGNVTLVYEDSDGNVEITGKGVCVGFDALENMLYSARFLLDEYENCVSGALESFFYFLTGEEAVSEAITEDGVTTIVSEYLYDNDDRLIAEFLLDAETGFLIEYSEWFAPADMEKVLECRATVIPGAEYEIPDELKALLNPERTRIVTAVMDTGETLDMETSADAQFILFVPEDYVVYADEERTTIFYEEWPEDDEFPAETTVYVAQLAE